MREAKATLPPATAWSSGLEAPNRSKEIGEKAIRCPDPTISFSDGFMVRRLCPDCSRIELSDLPEERDESKLVHSMGLELANVHLGSMDADSLGKAMELWDGKALKSAAETMADLVSSDFRDWQKAN